MAREVVYTDDLSGEHGAAPVRLGWNDVWFEVDLAEANHRKLTEFIEEYINAGRPVQAPSETIAPRPRAPRATGAKRQIMEEDYGMPRRGRASAEEQNYVKTHLDLVNKRRADAGHPPIDPTDAKMVARYGL